MRNKQFKCKLHISYEVIVSAENAEDAEIAVFEAMADDIGQGLIPMDVFEVAAGSLPIPMLNVVDVSPIKKEDKPCN